MSKNQERAKADGVKRRIGPVPVTMPSSGVFILESHHAASFKMEMQASPFHKICWVSVGEGWIEGEGSRVELRRNRFVIVPAGEKHRFVDHPKSPMTLVVLCVDEGVLQRDPVLGATFHRSLDRFPGNACFKAETRYFEAAIVDCFRRMLGEQSRKADGWQCMVISAFAELLAWVTRGGVAGETHGSPKLLEGLLEEIETRFWLPLTLQDAARKCGLSPRRFSEVFKAHTGFTFVEYLNRRRVAYAKERLLETGHVSYACYESGFQDLSYFYRIFKRYAGSPPAQWIASRE